MDIEFRGERGEEGFVNEEGDQEGRVDLKEIGCETGERTGMAAARVKKGGIRRGARASH